MPDNFNQASKKSQHAAKVASLDSLGVPFNEFIQREGMTILEKSLGDFVERVQENISNEKNMVTTGGITDISIEGSNGEIRVMAPAHLIYQDRGVNGSVLKLYDTPHSYKDKRPPVAAFKAYIEAKGIVYSEENDKLRKIDPRLSAKEQTEDRPFKELTDDQKKTKAAWAMSTKVFREGFKPRHLYSKEIPLLLDDIAEAYADIAIQQFNQVITPEIQPREGGGNRIIIK